VPTVLRTPEERFEPLPGWPYEPRYLTVSDPELGELRMHYVKEGEGPTVLLLHGEPTWSYLYRKMIPVLSNSGLTAIALDLVGFGRSDKISDPDAYSYERHVSWAAQAVFGQLNLQDTRVFVQDWGGLIGLRLVAQRPERFRSVFAANTGLPTGDRPLTKAFYAWREFSRTTPEFRPSQIIKAGCVNPPPEEELAAYDAPFPADEYLAGARVFPSLVPDDPDSPSARANREAWKVLESYDRPFVTMFSDADPITRGGHRVFLERVPGTKRAPQVTVEGAGHFLQEDKGEEIAATIAELIATGEA
jgi:haloalkane dehalogenase